MKEEIVIMTVGIEGAGGEGEIEMGKVGGRGNCNTITRQLLLINRYVTMLCG